MKLDEATMKEFFEKHSSSSIIDTILVMNPDIVQNLAGYFESNKAIFQGKLKDRIGKDEKLQFLKDEIQKHRDAIEKDIVSNAYNMFTQPKAQFLENSFKFAGSLSGMIPFLPKEYEQLHTPEFLASLTKLTTLDNNLSLEELGAFVKQLPLNDVESPALLDAFNSPDPLNATFTILIIIHFEKQYIQYLLTLYEEIESGKGSILLPAQAYNEKIEWLGSQKELGELFVELQKKGWIKEIKPKLITEYFDKAETISEILKPAFDKHTKQPTYEKIYTSRYKKAFDNIAHRPIKPNKK